MRNPVYVLAACITIIGFVLAFFFGITHIDQLRKEDDAPRYPDRRETQRAVDVKTDGNRGYSEGQTETIVSDEKDNSTAADELYAQGLSEYKRGNCQAAGNLLFRAAEMGSIAAMYELGLIFTYSNRCKKDPEAARKCFNEAFRKYAELANDGNSTAMYKIAVMYECGYGVDKDDMDALRWYRRSAHDGYSKAMYELGYRYEQGQGVEEDDEEAIQWFRSAARAGDASAMHSLGEHFDRGSGVEKNGDSADYWEIRAAELGNKDAMYFAAVAILDDSSHSEKDHERAVRWLRETSRRGWADAVLERIGESSRPGR